MFAAELLDHPDRLLKSRRDSDIYRRFARSSGDATARLIETSNGSSWFDPPLHEFLPQTRARKKTFEKLDISFDRD